MFTNGEHVHSLDLPIHSYARACAQLSVFCSFIMSSSSAQVPPANGERALANVPAFPYTVVEGGPQGEDITIPSGSTVTRSRSTPDRGSHIEIPQG